MFKFPLRIKPLNRLWNSTGPEQQQIWPFTEIVVDKYSSDAHFNDLYEAIQWKNKNYPNHHITIRFGEGEWVLQPSTRLINLSLVGPGREQATIVFNGDLNVYQPRVPITFRDFTIQANGNATYSVGLFYQGDVSSETLYCHNLNIQATNGSTGTYGVWLYGGGTIELHNCLAAAYTGGTEYGLYIPAGTCRVYGGGQYYGDTAPASVAGTLQLRDLPDIDATTIVGAGTVSWEWTRNGYNLVSKQINPTGHLHSKLVASDGSPDPALSVDASGNATMGDGSGNRSLTMNVGSAGGLAQLVALANGGSLFTQEATHDDTAKTSRWNMYLGDAGWPGMSVQRNDGSYTLADDTVATWSLTNGNRYFVFITTNGEEYFLGFVPYSGTITQIAAHTNFNVVAGAGTLTNGTGDGVDNKLNLRVNNGVLYFKNRTGGSRHYGIFVVAMSA